MLSDTSDFLSEHVPAQTTAHTARASLLWFSREREFSIDNLLVRIHFIIEMIWLTGLAPLEFEFPFPGSCISTFLVWNSMDTSSFAAR